MQDKDFIWFKENYMNLFQQYGQSYLAIKNKTVLGSYNSYADAVNDITKNHEIGSFIIQYCNGDESAYTNYISSFNFVGGVL